MKTWILLSLVVTILSTLNILAMSYITHVYSEHDDTAIKLCLIMVGIICFASLCCTPHRLQEFPSKLLVPTACIGVLIFINYIIFVRALRVAPNAGYAKAVINMNVISVAILSYYLFGSHLNAKSLVGLVLMVLGMVLIGDPRRSSP